MRVPVVGPTTRLFEFPASVQARGTLTVPPQYADGQLAQFLGCNGWFRGVAVEKDAAGRVVTKRLIRDDSRKGPVT